MDVYLHVKVLLSMILGLGVAHLLRGVARIVQHPKRNKIYWVHLVWSLFLFIYLIHFWWWEFGLQKVPQWTFPLYFFIAIYATLLYLLCSLFFPEYLDDYDGYRGYYYSRRQWIFALMAILFSADVIDTFIKGHAYLAKVGVIYDLRIGTYILLSILAIKIRNPRYHAVFAILTVMIEVLYIFKLHLTIS